MSEDDEGYDPELFDAEIIVNNTTTLASFTIPDLIEYLGHDERWYYRAMKRGAFPRPQWPQEHRKSPARWSRRQVIEVIAKRLEAGQKVPA